MNSAALAVKNKACVTRWQDIVKGGVKLDGLDLNVTQVCMFYNLLIPTSCKVDWIHFDDSYLTHAGSINLITVPYRSFSAFFCVKAQVS